MKNFETKNIGGGVLDVDGKTRRVKVAISRMGNLDHDNDIIDKSAYNRTIKERGPKGANLIWHLTDHTAQMSNAIGKFSELSVEKDYLVGITDIPETTLGKDILIMYEAGHINQHSVGFKTVQSEIQNKGKDDEYRLIKEIFMYEGSTVLWGANTDTPTLAVGKSLTKEQQSEQYFTTLTEIDNLAKLFRVGKLSDNTLELIEISLIQKTEKLKQLFENTIQPAAKAFDPVSKSLKVIDDFIEKL